MKHYRSSLGPLNPCPLCKMGPTLTYTQETGSEVIMHAYNDCIMCHVKLRAKSAHPLASDAIIEQWNSLCERVARLVNSELEKLPNIDGKPVRKMKDTEEVILPCPFCGDFPSMSFNMQQNATLYCNNDRCLIGPSAGQMPGRTAIKEWNKRGE